MLAEKELQGRQQQQQPPQSRSTSNRSYMPKSFTPKGASTVVSPAPVTTPADGKPRVQEPTKSASPAVRSSSGIQCHRCQGFGHVIRSVLRMLRMTLRMTHLLMRVFHWVRVMRALSGFVLSTVSSVHNWDKQTRCNTIICSRFYLWSTISVHVSSLMEAAATTWLVLFWSRSWVCPLALINILTMFSG